MTQLERLVSVLKNLGGVGTYKEIYRGFEEMKGTPLSNNQRAGIRACIEQHSSDSAAYREGTDDVFFSAEGIGKGVWGLRDYQPSEANMTMTQDTICVYEGRREYKMHLMRERNHWLIKQAKRRFAESHNGRLFCEICGFDFATKYGTLGENYVEAHHTKAVSQMNEDDKTNICDIVMVCSNCHSMLHRHKPWLCIGNIKRILI